MRSSTMEIFVAAYGIEQGGGAALQDPQAARSGQSAVSESKKRAGTLPRR